MDYATEQHIENKSPRSRKTATIAHAARGIRPLHATPQRRTRGTTGHPTARPALPTADGILRATFPSGVKAHKVKRTVAEKACIAQGFCTSLSQLTTHYGITISVPEWAIYPEGIAKAIKKAGKKLKKKTGFQSLRLVHNLEKAFLITEERYSTGTYLYYIPVFPLYKMLRDTRHRKAALVLLSVCSWLYRTVGVPYYRQEDAYLYWQYEMIREWIQGESEDEEEYTQQNKAELRTAALIGDLMEKKLRNPANIRFFTRRIECFTPYGELEGQCKKIAVEALALFTQYPHECIHRNIQKKETGDEDGQLEYEDDVIGIDKYLSFSATTQGWLFETLEEAVNNEFNECGEVEEPVIVKRFDGNPVSASLDFERRAFELINALCEILYTYKMA